MLKVSNIKDYEKKKKDYEVLKTLVKLDFIMSSPIEFGVCDNGKSVYTVFKWVQGRELEEALLEYKCEERYKLGFKSGNILKSIHDLTLDLNLKWWEDSYEKKIERNLKRYKGCSLKFKDDKNLIRFIENNKNLIKERPISFHHGDYHIGNLILTDKEEVGVIDFNRADYGDPWEEFNRITWCSSVSSEFATGMIDGYFENKVPKKFFKLLAYYIGVNQLTTLNWAIPFGGNQIKVMKEENKKITEDYSYYDENIKEWYIPKWYIKSKTFT